MLRTAEKVPLTFYLTRDAAVSLSVVNIKGEVVWTRPLKGKKGFNELRWDLVIKTEDSPEAYFFQYRQFTPAGKYTIRLTGEGIALETPLLIGDF
jgi:hypothetical protein